MRVSLLLLLPCFLWAEQEPEGRTAFIAASRKYHQGDFDAAIAGYQQTIALHHEVPFSKMMISRLWNLKGDIDKSMAALDDAAEFEFPGVQTLQTDPEFDAVRQDSRYPAILAKVRLNNQFQACPNRDRRHQFNFWLGLWSVSTADGKLLGADKVEPAEGGCLLRETWTGLTAGDTGQSNTFYDRLTSYWRQVWIDPSGQPLDYYGELIDGVMTFQQIAYNGGLKTITVVTYSSMPDGTVQQKGQRSTDDGATWITTSTFIFTRQTQ